MGMISEKNQKRLILVAVLYFVVRFIWGQIELKRQERKTREKFENLDNNNNTKENGLY